MKGNWIWIALAIIWGAVIIGNSIEKSNTPESIKMQQYETMLESEAEAEAMAQARTQFINTLSEMTWTEIYHLPDEKRLDALTHYGFRILALIMFGSLLLGGARYMFPRN